MFTFIKKVIKTGTATSSYPLEPIAVDKMEAVKDEVENLPPGINRRHRAVEVP